MPATETSPESSQEPSITFKRLGLSDSVLKGLSEVGYESPSPIQAQSIPPLLEGQDLLGQAQTGTGKTAAFALPFLSKVDLKQRQPQLLVLAPTRELAIQVSEAFQTYARFIKDFHVLPIYGGTSYEGQLRQLRRGVHAVVGTPGRVMDHIRKGTLKLDKLTTLVLDEADEMLRMGFIDDVEWILEHTPETRQTALFSATMPSVIRKVADRYLNNPATIKITSKTTTAKTINQRFIEANSRQKLDMLTRILEVEEFDAMLIFVRTKTATVELTEKLQARGYASSPLNGDIPQNQRERTVENLKKGKLDILIATDVAARGLDVERISHVINYDVPYDTETYVHRIGRTGRAGRKGETILFIASKEKRMLKTIEKATRQKIEPFRMPSTSEINEQRISRFKERINAATETPNLEIFQRIVSEHIEESDTDPLTLAAALAAMVQGDEPLLLSEQPRKSERKKRSDERSSDDKRPNNIRDSERRPFREKTTSTTALPLKGYPDITMQRYRVEVGYQHDVKPGNLVGAIANEADIESCYIGHIEICDDYTLIDLPDGMPKEIHQILKNTRVCGERLDIKLPGHNSSEKKNHTPRRKPKTTDDKKRTKKTMAKSVAK